MQKRLRNYKHSILSFEHNLYNLGMHNPGRYCGFDTMTPQGGLMFSINHTESGISYKDPNNSILGPFGMLLTPQGTLIMDDEEVVDELFVLETNAGNGEIRYDFLVFNHSQIQNSGGQPGTYSIIKGPINNPIFPVLTDPFKQIIVGIFEIPAGTADINACTYTKAKCPDSGDGEDARLYENNIFRGLQGFNTSNRSYTDWTVESDDIFSGSNVHSSLWELDGDANFYKIQPTGPVALDGIKLKNVPLQEGIEIKLLLNSFVAVRSNFAFYPSYAAKGYRGLFFFNESGNYLFPTGAPNQTTYAIRPPVGREWVITLQYFSNRWNLMSIDYNFNYFSHWQKTGAGMAPGFSVQTLSGQEINWYVKGNVCHLNFRVNSNVIALDGGGIQVSINLATAGLPLPRATGSQYTGSGTVTKEGSFTHAASVYTMGVSSGPLAGIVFLNDRNPPVAGDHVIMGQLEYEFVPTT